MRTITHATSSPDGLARIGRGGLKTGWEQFARLMTVWADRRSQRARLATLDERMLRDIGVDRVTALQEACKPFWRA